MDLYLETDLRLDRTLAVPRAVVWVCWTTPAHFSHDFVPKPHKVTARDIDLRPGGRFNTTFKVAGTDCENHGMLLEVLDGETLELTDGYTERWKPTPEPFLTVILLLSNSTRRLLGIARRKRGKRTRPRDFWTIGALSPTNSNPPLRS
ncbi:SRPBCC domain-containing protein [Tropicimonas isoalkanivorans]